MAYRIEISPSAIADIESIFLWIKEESQERAFRWVRGCYEIMLTLENFPQRCSLAIESKYMGIEVRQLLYQKQFLILFTVQNLGEEEGVVYIHRVRHGSQQRLENIQDLLGDEL
ncbi:MAG: type II toxin-antitoxin system RelE/ParE family toxin [Aphanizomenon gracile PMC649.10]|jgi:plasmid stabilization system protein ParE|nr:type II toxin-antitoxin system RelE/ParE family toxin [Aphanizomenon gracile PMC627.10]MDM3857248.1 type II toxin-antitoxin system RelE/ParE family toxin [Aphanizomenon gracile PMC649.10]MDM3859608.1 type II toxin-antitoxin system RelE/ParE family toxin [Aphanizomenon gracile PMC644.10]